MKILEAGLKVADSQRFRDALVAVYVDWYNHKIRSGEATPARQLELLNRALKYGPNDARLLAQLAKLAIDDWEQADQALASLNEALAHGVAPALVHLILGTQALKAGETEDALRHLALAYDRNPEMPAVLNNVACALANREEPDLDRALEFAQAAKRLSAHPEIHDTIGTILARMGRHREAIRELETALRAFPERRELHATLADVYGLVGQDALAQTHRRLGEEPPEPGSSQD